MPDISQFEEFLENLRESDPEAYLRYLASQGISVRGVEGSSTQRQTAASTNETTAGEDTRRLGNQDEQFLHVENGQRVESQNGTGVSTNETTAIARQLGSEDEQSLHAENGRRTVENAQMERDNLNMIGPVQMVLHEVNRLLMQTRTNQGHQATGEAIAPPYNTPIQSDEDMSPGRE